MALSGNVTIASGPAPTSMAFNIGLDSNHYLVQSDPSALNFKVACAETNAIVYTRTLAQWRTDLAGLSFGPTGTFNASQIWAVPETEFFYIVGFSFWYENTLGRSLAVGVRYKITDTTTVTVDGPGFCYSCSGTSTDRVPDVTGFTFATASIGGSLYAVSWIGHSLFFGGVGALTKVPIAGGTDLTTGAWEARCCSLPWGLAPYITTSARFYSNRSSIVTDPGGIGVYIYGSPPDAMVGFNPSKILYCVVNPATMVAGAQTDRSADFGIPFPDDGLNYAGASSGNSRDYYTSPSVTGTTANELIFGRSYSDSRQTITMRRFSQDLSTGIVSSIGITTFQGTADTFASPMDQVQFQRDPLILNTVMDDQTIFHFGGYANPSPPPTGTDRRFVAMPGPVRTAAIVIIYLGGYLGGFLGSFVGDYFG